MPLPEHRSEKQFQQVQHVQVDASAAGQRIDNFLLGLLKTAPRSLVYRLLRTGQVRVNKGRAKPHRKLSAGDVVRIPPVTLDAASTVHLPGDALQAFERSVIREDEHWLFLDKPAGLAVHAGTGVRFGIIDLAQHARDDKKISLVHRLDRETSGCLVLAKGREAAVHFQHCLRHGLVRKRYTALLAGPLSAGFTENAPLHKNQPRDGERMVVVDRKLGKPALSRFSVVSSGALCSLVTVEIETGRTHQIRVHAAHRNHPVIGDSRYGDRQRNRDLANVTGRRMCLHAAEISFPGVSSAAPPLHFSVDIQPQWLALHQRIHG
jgi:23S rRNA pseudouridine955/2504/2580 synthase